MHEKEVVRVYRKETNHHSVHPSNSSSPFITRGVRYSSEKIKEIIATSIMVHEYTFNVLDDEI